MRWWTPCLVALALAWNVQAQPSPTSPAAGASPTPASSPGSASVQVQLDKLNTEDPQPLSPGQYELELFFYNSNAKKSFADSGKTIPSGSAKNEQFYSLSLGLGLWENWDLSIQSSATSLADFAIVGQSEVPSGFVRSPARGGGVTDLQLSLRWRFLNDEEADFSMALVGGPSLSNEIDVQDAIVSRGSSFLSWQTTLVASKTWDRFTNNLELYYSFPVGRSDASVFHQMGLNYALGYQITDWLQPVIELNYAQALPQGDLTIETVAWTAGLLLSPRPNWNIYVGVQDTFAGRNTERFTSTFVGTSINF